MATRVRTFDLLATANASRIACRVFQPGNVGWRNL